MCVVGIAGSPCANFSPSHGKLCSPDATSSPRRGQGGMTRLGHHLPVAHQWDGQHPARFVGGGRPARRIHNLLGDRAGRSRQPQRLFVAAVGFLVAAALLHRHAVHFDQFVDHARGRRTRAGDQRRADAVAVHRLGAQAGDGELVKIAGHHDAGLGSAQLVELLAHLAGQHSQLAGVDAHRAQRRRRRRPRHWPRRSSRRRCPPAAWCRCPAHRPGRETRPAHPFRGTVLASVQHRERVRGGALGGYSVSALGLQVGRRGEAGDIGRPGRTRPRRARGSVAIPSRSAGVPRRH